MRFLFAKGKYNNETFIDFCEIVLFIHKQYTEKKIGDDVLLHQNGNELKQYFKDALNEPENKKMYNECFNEYQRKLIRDIIASGKTEKDPPALNVSSDYDKKYVDSALYYDCIVMDSNLQKIELRDDRNNVYAYHIYCLGDIKKQSLFIYERNPKHDKPNKNISPNLYPDEENQRQLYASFSQFYLTKNLKQLNSEERHYYYKERFTIFPKTRDNIYHSYNPRNYEIDDLLKHYYNI